MFVIEKYEKVESSKKLAVNDVIEVNLSKEKSLLKILAINGTRITVSITNNPGMIFVVDTEDMSISNIIVGKPMPIRSIQVCVKGLKFDVDAKTLSYKELISRKTEKEIKVGDTFSYNNSQSCMIMYMSEDKSLMVVKYVNSGKEVAITVTDYVWLRNTRVKGKM